MRIIVTGGRDYKNKDLVDRLLHALKPSIIGVGDCPTGADKFVREWVKKQDFPPQLTIYKADWDTQGKSAGPIRNKAMIDGESPWFCLAFPGGSGTRDCILQCRRADIPVLIVRD